MCIKSKLFYLFHYICLVLVFVLLLKSYVCFLRCKQILKTWCKINIKTTHREKNKMDKRFNWSHARRFSMHMFCVFMALLLMLWCELFSDYDYPPLIPHMGLSFLLLLLLLLQPLSLLRHKYLHSIWTTNKTNIAYNKRETEWVRDKIMEWDTSSYMKKKINKDIKLVLPMHTNFIFVFFVFLSAHFLFSKSFFFVHVRIQWCSIDTEGWFTKQFYQRIW